MILKADDIGPGDEILFCSHTMVATASAIKFTGAKPVPVEAGFDHLMDPKSIEHLITENTKGIMPTQLNGRIAEMDEIQEIANKYGINIYEDSAQALGAKYNGQYAGSFGQGGCISFYPAKLLGCFGDGGAVITNNDEIYERVKLYRDHGRNDSGEITIWGYNSRLDNLQAAFLNYFFADFENVIDRRRAIAEQYNSNLKDVEELLLPPSPNDISKHYDVYQNYEIEADQRDLLKEFLQKKGISTMIQWGGKGVHQIKELGFDQSLPFTENLMSKSIMLPMNMFISDSDIDYISESIKNFYSE
jgi:dTDP-4-amino-4,6-dideoxygalactose transaminase